MAKDEEYDYLFKGKYSVIYKLLIHILKKSRFL